MSNPSIEVFTVTFGGGAVKIFDGEGGYALIEAPAAVVALGQSDVDPADYLTHLPQSIFLNSVFQLQAPAEVWAVSRGTTTPAAYPIKVYRWS